MKPDPKGEIMEGEIYGAPVPGGWPDRGPLEILGDALGRVFGRRRPGDRAEALRRPASDSPEPTCANLAEHDSEKYLHIFVGKVGNIEEVMIDDGSSQEELASAAVNFKRRFPIREDGQPGGMRGGGDPPRGRRSPKVPSTWRWRLAYGECSWRYRV